MEDDKTLETGEEEKEAPEPGEEVEGEEKEPEEKEPTLKELADLVKAQSTQIDKANKRTQYLQRKLDRANKAPAREVKPKPQEEDFETHSEYVESLTDWKAEEREKKAYEEHQKEAAKTRTEDFFSVIESGVEKYTDFNEVARKTPEQGGPTITGEMLEAMMDCENVVDIAYYLGQNVNESVRIANLGAVGAAREIGKLDVSLNGTKLQQKVKKTKITPQEPLKGKTKAETKIEDMSTEDFMRSRNQADGVE